MKIYFCKDINNARETFAVEGGIAKVVNDGFDLYADNIINILKDYYASTDLNDFKDIYYDTVFEWTVVQSEFEDVVVLYDDGTEDTGSRKFFLVDETIGGDIFNKMFDTLDEANGEADMQWYHLTDNEKRKRHVYVAWVTPEMLTEEGDWDSYHSMDSDEYCFNSDTWYAYLTDGEDNDWGTGSFILADVVKMWKDRHDYQPDARIAVIDDGVDPVCRGYLYADEIEMM